MSSSRSPSRALRKRPPATLADDLDYDLERLLKEHERIGAEQRAARRDAKKRKEAGASAEEDAKYAGAFVGYEIPFDDLPALCVERIFSMMDSPQDLHNLAFTSKFLMSLVTPETVIRSAVFHNLRKRDKGHRKVMANVMGYINNRSIHVPSAHRLLRLLTARSCEMGARCWGRNLNTGQAMPLPPGCHGRPFGLALCDKCVKFGTTKVPYSHFSRFQRGVAFHQWNLLIDPVRDPASTTDPVNGPLVEVLALQQVENTYADNDDKKAALEGMVQRALTHEGACCPLHYEERAAAYQEMWENAEREADDQLAAALEADQRKYRERRGERIAKRMTRIRSIHAALQEILEDCPLKDLALDCQWLEGDERCVKYTCYLVEHKLSNIISAPASASDRSIITAGEHIKGIFNTLHEKSFFQYRYLEHSSNRLRRGIYDYCVNETTPLKIMQSSLAGDIHFMQALEEDKPARALIRAVGQIRGAFPRVFALSVMRQNPDVPEAEARVDDYRRLAEVVWTEKAPSASLGFSFATIKETFNAGVEEFRIMKKNARDYLADDQTQRFLLRDVAVAGREDFTRQDALNQVFCPRTHSIWMQGTRNSAYQHLRNRNYESLRSLHEQIFRRPSQYGL